MKNIFIATFPPGARAYNTHRSTFSGRNGILMLGGRSTFYPRRANTATTVVKRSPAPLRAAPRGWWYWKSRQNRRRATAALLDTATKPGAHCRLKRTVRKRQADGDDSGAACKSQPDFIAAATTRDGTHCAGMRANSARKNRASCSVKTILSGRVLECGMYYPSR